MVRGPKNVVCASKLAHVCAWLIPCERVCLHIVARVHEPSRTVRCSRRWWLISGGSCGRADAGSTFFAWFQTPSCAFTVLTANNVLKMWSRGLVVAWSPPVGLDSTWELHWCAQSWGFSTSDDAEPDLCNTLLQMTLWRSSECMFVQERQRDGRLVESWLADAHREHARQYASWRGKGDIPVTAKPPIIPLVSPRDGATTFLNWWDVQTPLDLHCAYDAFTWISENRNTWGEADQTLRCACHFLTPSSGTTAETVVIEVFDASPHALVHILSNGVMNMKSPADRDTCRRCLRGYCENMHMDTTFFVQVVVHAYAAFPVHCWGEKWPSSGARSTLLTGASHHCKTCMG